MSNVGFVVWVGRGIVGMASAPNASQCETESVALAECVDPEPIGNVINDGRVPEVQVEAFPDAMVVSQEIAPEEGNLRESAETGRVYKVQNVEKHFFG